jgi:hypothetical protein
MPVSPVELEEKVRAVLTRLVRRRSRPAPSIARPLGHDQVAIGQLERAGSLWMLEEANLGALIHVTLHMTGSLSGPPDA